MAGPDTHDLNLTRRRLLEAAGEVFALAGFRDATVREICAKAGVNVAAINYHFGDKDQLYREVLAYSGRMALEKYPVTAGVPEDSPAAERLAGFIGNYLDRLLDEGRPAWHGKLIAQELIGPTAAFDQLVEGFVRPQYERLRVIVSELLGPGADENTLRRCVGSVVGQCLFYKHCRAVLDRLMPGAKYGPVERRALAEHISRFALAGIVATASRAGARPAARRTRRRIVSTLPPSRAGGAIKGRRTGGRRA